MKLQKLIINNIASITDATINFEEEPLKSSSIFLITGPTGSGKTTILDAICLALFNKTPRLDSVAAEKFIDGNTYSNNDEASIKELSDIIGAIEKIAVNHGLSLEDLINFSNKVKGSKKDE